MNFLSALRSVSLNLITNFAVRVSWKMGEGVMYIAMTEDEAVWLFAEAAAFRDGPFSQVSSPRRQQAVEE